MKLSKNSNTFIHHLADVQSSKIGAGTNVWQFVVVLKNAKIGTNCNICCNTFIENNVTIGDNVTVKSGVYIWDGTIIKNNVFIGPCVVFTNDLRPRSKSHKPISEKIVLNEGCSIGANTTLLIGVSVGKYAMTGIGSVVTRDVLSHELVFGNPAKHRGWVDEEGNKLMFIEKSLWKSAAGDMFKLSKTGMKKL